MRGKSPRNPLFSCPGPSRVGSLCFQAQAESATALCRRGLPFARPAWAHAECSILPLGETAGFSKSCGNEFVTC